jgi:hypothetical protein
MTVGVKKKQKRAFTPVFPKSIDTKKKGKGSKELKELDKAIEESLPLETEIQEEIPVAPDGESNFLEDLLWVYSKLGGRAALLSRARRDPAVRNQVFQTLLRMESKKQEIEAKRKDKTGADRKGLLLIFKGLEDSEKGLKVAEGKVSRKEMLPILEPGSDLNEAGLADKDEYRYSLQELTDEESKEADTEGQNQDSEGREEEREAEGEEILMDEVIDG